MQPDDPNPVRAVARWSGDGVRGIVRRVHRLLLHPASEWAAISERLAGSLGPVLTHTGLLSLLASLVWASGQAILLPAERPVVMFLFLVSKTFALYVVSVVLVAASIFILMPAYGVARDARRAMTVAGFGATPFLVCGLLAAYPLFSIAMVIALPLAGYQLYVGAQAVARVRRGDAAEFAAATMVLASFGSIASGGVLAALGWF